MKTFNITVSYRLSVAGQKNALISGCSSRYEQTDVIGGFSPEFICNSFVKIDDDGDLSLDLYGLWSVSLLPAGAFDEPFLSGPEIEEYFREHYALGFPDKRIHLSLPTLLIDDPETDKVEGVSI